MNFLRGSRRRKDRTTKTCRSTSLISLNRRRFPTSIKKKKHRPNWTNRLLKNAKPSPQNSYVSDDAFSDACSENYNDLYASGTFDLNAAAHDSLWSDSSLAQKSAFSDSSHEEDVKVDTILILTSGEEHGIFLDVGKEMVGSSQEGTTIVGKVPPSENGVCTIKGNNAPSYLSVSVARGMSSLLSLCSSEEDAFIELISTNSSSPSSSSFEDIFQEQDNTSDSSCSCSLSSRSPRHWYRHQDDEVQTQINCMARTSEEGSSSILMSSRTAGGVIKTPYNVEDSNNGIVVVNHLALHDSNNTKSMPNDSRDDDDEENDRTQDEFEEPRILPPPNFPSVLPPQCTRLYEGGVFFNEDGKYIDAITEEDISNQSLSRNPQRISQRIRCFQVKKLIREKNKNSSNKEDLTSYMPLLENASVTPMNFQTHELVVEPLAKKLKSVNTQRTKVVAWDYPSNDVVVKEQQAPRRSTPKDTGGATDTDVISESITKGASSQTRTKSPPLSYFLTIDEKEEEHGSSTRTHDTINVSKTVVDPSDHKLHDDKEEIITTVPNLVHLVSSSSLVLDQHSDDFPTRASGIDCHRNEDNTMKELLSFHHYTKSRPGAFVMPPSAGNKQATKEQLEKIVPEREACSMTKTSQGMVYQEMFHDDRPTRVKEGIMFKTAKSVSTQTSPTKHETFSSLLSILNIPADVKDHLPSDSSSIGSGCDSIFPRHDDIDKMMMSKRGSDGGNNSSTTLLHAPGSRNLVSKSWMRAVSNRIGRKWRQVK